MNCEKNRKISCVTGLILIDFFFFFFFENLFLLIYGSVYYAYDNFHIFTH